MEDLLVYPSDEVLKYDLFLCIIYALAIVFFLVKLKAILSIDDSPVPVINWLILPLGVLIVFAGSKKIYTYIQYGKAPIPSYILTEKYIHIANVMHKNYNLPWEDIDYVSWEGDYIHVKTTIENNFEKYLISGRGKFLFKAIVAAEDDSESDYYEHYIQNYVDKYDFSLNLKDVNIAPLDLYNYMHKAHEATMKKLENDY